MKLQINYVPIAQISPSEYNPRAISKEALEGLKHSLTKFGCTQPLIVNKKTNVLVGGHQRLRAAAELGWQEVPVVYVDLSEMEEKALNVVLNNKHIEGFFIDELQVVLQELKSEFGDDYFTDLKFDSLVTDENWGADLDSIGKIEEDDSGVSGKIVITCKEEDKDHLLIRIKELILETSFEGVHIA